MDDDLFGGLPAVSKADNAQAPETDLFGGLPSVLSTTENAPVAPLPTSGLSGSASASAPAPIEPHRGGEEQIGKASNIIAAPPAVEKRKAGKSLVGSLGTSGTSMAFVPHAIRKKKKVSQQPKSQPQKQIATKKQVIVEDTSDVKNALNDNDNQTDSNTNAIPNRHKEDTHNKSDKEGRPMISEISYTISSNKQNIDQEQSSSDKNPQPENSNDTNTTTINNNTPYIENEPESLRLLHLAANVTTKNLYDPHFPNDYLAHRERKKTEQARKDMQRSALQRLDQQEKLRKKIEEERKKILESGNFTNLDKFVGITGRGGGDGMAGIMGGAGRGRGRGRSVNNLPAWLVKKQQEQKDNAQGSSDNSKPVAPGQFDDTNQ